MNLNRRQRFALFVGLVVAVVMGLFPPWMMKVNTGYVAQGYNFIAHELIPLEHFSSDPSDSPISKKSKKNSWIERREEQELVRRLSRMDTALLWTQWFTLAFATTAIVVFLGDWSRRNTERTD